MLIHVAKNYSICYIFSLPFFLFIEMVSMWVKLSLLVCFFFQFCCIA
jgi:hypothetical protein